MPALNFSEQFADDVAAFRKMNTIRQTSRCKVGEVVFLYTGLRTKKAHKLGEGVCTEVYPVSIHENKIVIRQGLDSMTYTHLDALATYAQRDGFKDWQGMVDWFKGHYGMPFHGWFHAWRPRTGDR